VAVGGELRAEKWCKSKPPLMALQSHADMTTNPRAARGSPLGIKPQPDLDERSVNEKGVEVETLTHSINRRHGGSGCGSRTVSLRSHDGRFFLQPHAELSLHLTGAYTHSLTEEGADERL
jgi:hypothetical protein